MRPLNRPMFRYGGPIKEGVMDGIREPRKNGGSMSQLVQPSGTGMRPGYKGKSRLLSFIPGFSQVAQSTKGIIPRIFNKIKPTFKMQPGKITQNKTVIGNKPDGTPIFGYSGTGQKYASQTMPPVPFSQRASAFVKENPYFTGAVAPFALSTTAAVAPPVAKGIGSIAKATGMQLADLAVPDFIFDQDQYFKDKEEAKIKKELEASELTAQEKKIKELEALLAGGNKPDLSTKSAEELRADKIAKYRDIVDIKGMNKDAAYNSLIAASQAINESGDFKGDIKSGKLINQIIQATSKQFDKPKQTKDAIDTLILKGEIDKDIKASDPSAKLLNEYRLKQMEKIDKDLNTGFAEAKIAASKNLSGQSAIDAAASVASENFKGNLLTKTQLTDVMEAAKGSGEISEQDIIISATTEVIKGKNLPDGDYTVGDVLVTITEGQVTNIKR